MEKISENQNIHNMMKYNQPVGRLRDRAPSLLAGRFELERRRYSFRVVFECSLLLQEEMDALDG